MVENFSRMVSAFAGRALRQDKILAVIFRATGWGHHLMKRQHRNNLILFLAAMVCVHAFFIWHARSLIRQGYPDFTIFYSAAKIVREGLGPKLYDPDLQYRAQQLFASGVSVRQGALPYNHPPFEALVFIPLTWLSYLPAYIAWDTFNLFLLWAVAWRLRSNLPGRAGTAWGLFAALAFFPVCVALLQGQDIILFSALLTFAFLSFRQGSDFTAGCWLGLGLFRFQLVLPLVVLLALGKRFKTLVGFAGVGLALFFVSAAITGWHGLWEYPGYVWHVEQTMGHGAIVPADMPNLRGLLASALTGWMPKVQLQALTVILSFALIVFAARQWRLATRPDSRDLILSLFVVTTVLVSYHAFAYDLCLLLLPVALLLNFVERRNTLRNSTRMALLVPIALLFIGPLQMLLWLHYGQLCLMALVLGAWIWGIARSLWECSEDPEALPQADS